MINKLEIISVNYNTPDLIDKMIKSVREIEGNYHIHIIDGSDREPYKTDILEVCKKYDNVNILQTGYNIHHGRGMDLGVSISEYEWVLIIDSDNNIMQPTIDKMLNYCITNNKMICAYRCYVNQYGISTGKTKSPEQPICYYHPMLFLIKKDYYFKLKSIGITFIHHGAPCIAISRYLHDNNLSEEVGVSLHEVCEFGITDYGKWVNLESRGTRNRFGMNL